MTDMSQPEQTASTPYEFDLLYDRVDPGLDLDALHGVFFADDMDVLVGSGRLDSGAIGLMVSVQGTGAKEALDRVLTTARRALVDGRLIRVEPDAVDLQEIGFLTQLPLETLKDVAEQDWFPAPVSGRDRYRVDAVVQAIGEHSGTVIDNAAALLDTVQAARAVNEHLIDLNA